MSTHRRALNPADGESRWLQTAAKTSDDADRLGGGARARITESADKPVAGLRVGVKNGGCAGMSYTMELAERRRAARRGHRGQGRQGADRPEGGAVPARREMDFKVDRLSATFSSATPTRLGLRLRRERRDHPRQPRKPARARVTDAPWPRARKPASAPSAG